mmetsp:Transcript_4014/g.8931  ORF Transcript_4014/g.8931 Transcript_4014/m.8931 type:complete len:246 (+) Transcript_4014:736-1473(+)
MRNCDMQRSQPFVIKHVHVRVRADQYLENRNLSGGSRTVQRGVPRWVLVVDARRVPLNRLLHHQELALGRGGVHGIRVVRRGLLRPLLLVPCHHGNFVGVLARSVWGSLTLRLPHPHAVHGMLSEKTIQVFQGGHYLPVDLPLASLSSLPPGAGFGWGGFGWGAGNWREGGRRCRCRPGELVPLLLLVPRKLSMEDLQIPVLHRIITDLHLVLPNSALQPQFLLCRAQMVPLVGLLQLPHRSGVL